MFGRGRSSVLPAWMTESSGDTTATSSISTHHQEELTHSNASSTSINDYSNESRKRTEQSTEAANILNALNETPSTQPGQSSSKSSVKRSSESAQYFSRFDKKQETTHSAPTSQPLMQLNLSKGRASKSSSSSAADWRVCKTAEGVEYYYNQRTRATTYDKPDVLKSEAERSLKPCAWKEFKTSDGRTYWNNADSGISVWEEPDEYKEYKNELARLQEQNNTNMFTSSLTPPVVQDSPFITTVTTTGPPTSPVPVAAAEPSPQVEEEKPAVVSWNTPAEARQAFESLLAEVVKTPSMSWKEAVPQLTRDIRFTAIEKAGQRKQIFSEFVNKMMKAKKEAKMKKAVQLKEEFRSLLMNCPHVTAESTLAQVESVLRNNEIWDMVDGRERDDEIRDYLQKLQQKDREAKKEAFKKEQALFEGLLEELQVGSRSKWTEFESAIQERFKSKIIAGDSQRDLFYDYVDKLRNREEKATAAVQAKLKQDVYDLFEEYLKNGKITADTKYTDIWQDVEKTELFKEIQEKKVRLKGEFIFKDFMLKIDDRVQMEVQDMLYFLKKSGLKWERGFSMESFNEVVRKLLEEVKESSQEEVKESSQEKVKEKVEETETNQENEPGKATQPEVKEPSQNQTKQPSLTKEITDYFISWLEFVEKRPPVATIAFDRVKKEMNRRLQSPEERAFKELLSDYLYTQEHLEYSYKDVEPQLKVRKRWSAVKEEKDRRVWYEEYMSDLKEKIERKKQRRQERYERNRR